MFFAGGVDDLLYFSDHRVQTRRFQMTEVEGHAHFARNDVARTGIGLQAADGAAGMRLVAEGGAVDGADDHRSADQCIFAQVHRRRAGMRFDAAKFEVEPLLPQSTEHHADGFLFVFEDRALLDVRLEIGADLMPADLARASVADRVERFANGDAVGIDFGEGFFEGEFLGEHTGAHHAWGEA
ncbi:hypothetical protein D3C72_1270100 [compost metagenome]